MDNAGTAAIVRAAWEQGLAVPAFNIPYLPMMDPVVRAVRDQDAFALVAVARLEWIKFEAGGLAAVRRTFDACRDDRHVRLHLDHVPVIDEDGRRVDARALIEEALALGYQSVMVDGSRLALEDNLRATREIAGLAHAAGVPCEAELGAVLGHEPGPPPSYEELFRSGRGFTRPDEARRFVRETGCDWLSVAVGNMHGALSTAASAAPKAETRLDLERLERLREAAGVPLVLHGGTGVRRADLHAAMRRGIAKINVAADLRRAYDTARDAGVAAAQAAVYARTVALLDRTLGLAGTRARLAGP